MRPTDKEIAELPEYVFPGTDADFERNQLKVMEQVREIVGQTGCMTELPRVTCAECDRKLPVTFMYHCLYCEMFFCKRCAQFHFGKRLPNRTGD